MNINVTGACLTRLRVNRNISSESLAQRTGITLEDIKALEKNSGTVSMKEVEKIAAVLKLSWYALLDETLEPERIFGNDNRSTRHKNSEYLDVETQKVMEDVVYLLDLANELNPDSAFDIPRYGKSALSPEGHAKYLRTALGIETSNITKLGDEYAVWRFWKETLSSTGLYIFERSWNTKSVRAFSISKKNKAAAVVSTKDIPSARLFSLLHEVYHLINKQSAICDITSSTAIDIEAECNRFAASFLMPENEFDDYMSEMHFVKNKNNNVDDNEVKLIQKHFKVSRLAVYRRLLTLSYISKAQYLKIQSGYRDYEITKKSSGGSAEIFYKTKLNGVGLKYASEMFTAYANGTLNAVSVARVFDVRVSQLNTISKMVGDSGRTG